MGTTEFLYNVPHILTCATTGQFWAACASAQGPGETSPGEPLQFQWGYSGLHKLKQQNKLEQPGTDLAALKHSYSPEKSWVLSPCLPLPPPGMPAAHFPPAKECLIPTLSTHC